MYNIMPCISVAYIEAIISEISNADWNFDGALGIFQREYSKEKTKILGITIWKTIW